MADRKYDVVVYGASGYTGRLVAEYMAKTHPDASWAMAGRNADKLAEVRDEIDVPNDTPLVVADTSDEASLKEMVASTKCVLTTVGPYQLYGSPVVAACAELGTHYVDLTGEPAWMKEMIEAHADAAKASGARIVFSCGFDSIPFDLGVFFLQEKANEKLGAAVPRVRARVRSMQGEFSGGTAASLTATNEAVAKNPDLIQALINPFALCQGFSGPQQPADNKPYEDDVIGSWVMPFIMAVINSKNVHRSNFLLGHPYGENFEYDEMMMTGPGDEGKAAVEAMANANPFGDKMPQPGEGPSKESREAGFYDVLFVGTAADGSEIRAAVTGDMDPGYGSTSKMIAESALCIVEDCDDLPGGIYTPAPAMGSKLIARLVKDAGMTFDLEQ